MKLVYNAPSRKKDGIRKNATVMADILRSMKEHTKAYMSDIVYDIFALDERVRQYPATQDEAEIFVIGIRECGADSGELIAHRIANAVTYPYPGGIYRFTMQTDPDSPDGGIILRVYKEGTP